jgi:hypothetical protein
MHALRLASGTPSALLDWNNNYGSDPNKAVCFHCSNLPKHFFRSVKMDFQEIIAGTVGKENTFGTCVGLIKPEKMSFARFSTDDTAGKMRGYVGEGRFTDDPLNTFGGAGVVEIPQMQRLLHFICERGFEHHVQRIFPPWPGLSTRQPRATSAGTCTGTKDRIRLVELEPLSSSLHRSELVQLVNHTRNRIAPDAGR